MVRRVTRRLTDLARRRKEPPPRPLRPTAAAVSDRLRRLTKLPAACSSHTFEPVVADQRDTAEHAAVSPGEPERSDASPTVGPNGSPRA